MSLNAHYHAFLIEQRFEEFRSISPCFMRHGLAKALVQWFHAEKSTFHLSRGEYVVLPMDWTSILCFRFGGKLVLIKFMSFEDTYELLSIAYPFIRKTRGYFRPT